MKENSNQIDQKSPVSKVFTITKTPRHGYITEIAKIYNCSRRTVTRALFEGHTGPKSNEVIRVFNEKYKI